MKKISDDIQINKILRKHGMIIGKLNFLILTGKAIELY